MPTLKESALNFLTLLTTGRIAEAYDTYTSKDFRHHNAYFKSDRASLQKGMEDSDETFPNKVFKVQRALEDGDTVAVHSHVILKPKELEVAAVHILRFEDGKIVEMWDIALPIPEDSPNELGMF